MEHPDHVAAWARELDSHAGEDTTLNDQPEPSFTITQTPPVRLGNVEIRVLHLKYLTDARPGHRRR